MKLTLNALATALLISTSASALAASTVDLTVQGVITPNACTPSLSGSGVVDYGKISAKDLNLTTVTQLPRTTLQLTITCEGGTLFAIKGTDNRAGSNSSAGGYGLGLINGTQKLGAYDVVLLNAVADSGAVSVLESMDNGITWSDSADAILPVNALGAFGDKSSGVWLPVSIQQVTTDLLVYGQIARADSLDLSDEHPIDGSATFEVKYL
ncbi:DUF1120 domain-containing protein [Pseudomonas sp. F8002]|jgi:type 1 fimbria pilin|uniref:DUF1120 domain-containing protein n=1 Tax=Pseudomonas sp. F8002 TaxID=2738822 RepID=UPI0015A0C9B9|nr:DUF1120 domain-containing protein [Pseudomonas sp. F8002]NWB51573.1 DUF1120 domain-containing protein [Pseudomonas sp. F8002]